MHGAVRAGVGPADRALSRQAEDGRFRFGLAYGVAKLLAEHGYPDITARYEGAGEDFSNLQLALFRFLYADEPNRPPADGWTYEREDPQPDPNAGQVQGYALGRWGEDNR